MSKKSKKKSRSLLLTAGVCVVVVLYTLLVFLPIHKSVAKLRADVESQQTFVDQTNQLSALSDVLQEELAAAQATIVQWNERAASGGSGNFLRDLTSIVADTGVTLQRITPDKAKSLGTLERHPIVLTIEGQFSQIGSFVAAIESRPAIAWIDRIDLQPALQDSELLRCELSLTVFADNRSKSDQVALNTNRY